MKLPQKNRLVFLLFTALALVIISCSDKKDLENEIYVKPPKEKLDSLNSYFSEVKNFTDKNYLPTFYTNFNEKLKEKQWEKAAQMLLYAGNSAYSNDVSDSLLLHTHIDFINKHVTDIANRYQSGIYGNIGNLFYYDLQPQKAVYYYKKALEIPYSDYYTLKNITGAFIDLTYVYSETGKLDSALVWGFKGLDLATKLKDTISIGANYDAIAVIYSMMDDDVNADTFYEKAKKLLKSINNDRGVFTVYLNKLELLYKNNDDKLLPQIDSMYRFYQTCDFGNDSYIAYANGWYAYKLVKENRLSEAKKILDATKPIFDRSDKKFTYSTYLDAVSLYDEQTGNQTLDKSYYVSVIPKYKETKMYQNLSFCYETLKREAIKKSDYKTALYYQEELEKTMDSLASSNLKKQVKNLDKKYQTEKKEQLIAFQSTELKQKSSFIYALIASLIGLLLAALTYYLWQKQKTLKQEKTNSMNFTKQLLENTEEERKRIASDLHDSISHDLLSLKTGLSQDIQVVSGKIDAIINDIRIISRNLHPIMFDKIGLESNIEQLVERIQIQNNFMVSTEINYQSSLNATDELQIYRIIQESLSNIIKYAKAHAAKITMEEMSDKVFIEIRDNGKGFNVKETLNSNTSFGLHNIIERSRAIGGVAEINSSAEGTFISVNIPKKS